MEHMILYIVYACTFISLAYIPKNKWREASIAYFFQQCTTWFLGLLTVELDLLEYPVREFANINETSFLFEFLFYPIVGSFFCIYYPRNKSMGKKILYTSAFCTSLTIPEVIVESYTNLINYLKWEWYITWLSLYITLKILWIFYKWFFQLNEKPSPKARD